MTRRPIRLPSEGRPLFEIFSAGRTVPQHSGRFSRAQIEQIARTLRGTPEVMVKVTGGGAKVGAASAHLGYISRQGALAIETDEGERITSRDEQKALLRDCHLELSAGQYRRPTDRQPAVRTLKLVHNIVLSMPAPTPREKVLAAARKFARENFAATHRYAMVRQSVITGWVAVALALILLVVIAYQAWHGYDMWGVGAVFAIYATLALGIQMFRVAAYGFLRLLKMLNIYEPLARLGYSLRRLISWAGRSVLVGAIILIVVLLGLAALVACYFLLGSLSVPAAILIGALIIAAAINGSRKS